MDRIRRRLDHNIPASIDANSTTATAAMKTTTIENNSNDSSQYLNPSVTAAASGGGGTADETPTQPVLTAVDYKDALLLAIAPPFLILLVFGGKLSVLIMCFGGLICYIFDLLGSIEGTMITMIINLLCLLSSLVYAGRVFLTESILNFSLVLIIWIILFYTFIISCNYFDSIINEVGIIIAILDILIFATLPLIASVLITWFLCVEIPSLDLNHCFNFIYFLYMMYLAKPRKITNLSKHKERNSYEMKTLLSLNIILIMYLIPICISLIIFIMMHHNVLSSMETYFINMTIAIFEPFLFMCYCAKYQKQYFSMDLIMGHHTYNTGTKKEYSVASILDTIIMIISLILIFCIQDHPMFDDIKKFSGLSHHLAGFYIISSLVLIIIAYGLHHFITSQQGFNNDKDIFTKLSKREQGDFCWILLHGAVTFCISASTALIAYVIDIPTRAIPITIVGAASLTEYYHRHTYGTLSRILLVIVSAMSIALTAYAFAEQTVFYLKFTFSWIVEISMQRFSQIFSLLLAVAVALPTLACNPGRNSSTGLLPDGLSNAAGAHPEGMTLVTSNSIFEWIFPIVGVVFAALELMIREQDWSLIQVPAHTVYPSYYMLGTTLLLGLTAAVMFNAGVIGPACVWIVWVVQCSKLLHLLGLSSTMAGSLALMILAYSLPFIRQVTQYIRRELLGQSDAGNADKHRSGGGVSGSPLDAPLTVKVLSPIEVFTYVVIATLASYWAYAHGLAENIQLQLLSRQPSIIQQLSLCLGLWLAYMGCIMFVFVREVRLLRSCIWAISTFMFLVAFEGFGGLSLAMDESSSFYLTVSMHPDMGMTEHPVLFVILSSALTAVAWLGIIPLSNFFTCLLYGMLFAFISTKATIGWAFPLSMASDSLTHDLFSFPFCYIYMSKFLLTMTAAWNPGSYFAAAASSSSYSLSTATMQRFGLGNIEGSTLSGAAVISVADAFCLGACLLPFLGLFWAWLYHEYFYHSLSGIAWTSIIGYSSLCLSARAREIALEVRLVKTGTGRATVDSASNFLRLETSVTLLFATLAVFWTAVAVMNSPNLDKNLFVPLASLLFLCTKSGTVLPETSPLILIGGFCSVWWTASSLWAIFGSGMETTDVGIALEMAKKMQLGDVHTFPQSPQGYFGRDTDISIWTSDGLFWPLLNLAEMMIPLPGIMMCLLRSKQDSEDMLFVLALFSAVPIIAAQVWSIRYLGLIGMAFSMWRCYELGQLKHRSDRMI